MATQYIDREVKETEIARAVADYDNGKREMFADAGEFKMVKEMRKYRDENATITTQYTEEAFFDLCRKAGEQYDKEQAKQEVEARIGEAVDFHNRYCSDQNDVLPAHITKGKIADVWNYDAQMAIIATEIAEERTLAIKRNAPKPF